MASKSNSASHWCKTVIEEVVPSLSTSHASSSSLLVDSANGAPKSKSPFDLQPQYQQLYEQYYKTSSSSTSVSKDATESNSSSVAATGKTVPPPPIPPSMPPPSSAVNSSGGANFSYAAAVSNSTSKVSPSNYVQQYYQNIYGQAYPAPPNSASSTNIASIQTPSSVAPTNLWGSGGNYYTQPVYPSYAAAVATGLASVPPPPLPPSSQQYYSNQSQLSSNNLSGQVGKNVVPSAIDKKPNPARFSAAASAPVVVSTAKTASDSQPASLKQFVLRSFQTCISDAEREYVGKELNKIIAKITSEGRLHVHKWDLEPAVSMPVIDVPSQPKDSLATKRDRNSMQVETSEIEEIIYKKSRRRWDQHDTSSIAIPSPAPSPLAAKSSVLAGVDKLLTAEEMRRREGRANRFQEPAEETLSKKELNKRKKAAAVTARAIQQLQQENSSSGAGDFDLENLKIVGTCQKLEKDYLRLTSAPLPSAVRPEPVLRKSIQFIKRKWDADEVDYVYMCSQLKSIRQDLTIQHIKNDFTVHAYEVHARVALESSDLNEYNQCQTQLKQLYSAGLKGSEMEFIAYRVLYYIYLMGNKKYTAGSTDLIFLLASLSAAAKSDPAVKHALDVQRALQQDDYHSFFKLYAKTPNFGNCILDLMLDSIRLRAVQRICKAMWPTVSLLFVIEELGFEDKELGAEFLQRLGCIIAKEGEADVINTKESTIDSSALFTQEKLLL